jgi:hypothetical protein
LKGLTLTIPLGAIGPGFVVPKFELPIKGFTKETSDSASCAAAKWNMKKAQIKLRMFMVLIREYS